MARKAVKKDPVLAAMVQMGDANFARAALWVLGNDPAALRSMPDAEVIGLLSEERQGCGEECAAAFARIGGDVEFYAEVFH